MAPLAGKPPYATDEPDSFYESSPAPQRRVRQQPPADPNKRTSAYDMYVAVPRAFRVSLTRWELQVR